MALGDVYNSNKRKEVYSPTVYSAFGFGNTQSTIDPTSLRFSFWNKMLKVTIVPLKIDANGKASQDSDNAADIYLSHMKAKILETDIRAFLKNPQEFSSAGVNSSSGLITISNGVEFGVTSPCLVIKSINEDGNVTATFVYEFRTEHHYSIRNFNEDGSFDKIYYAMLEVEAVADLLEQYYISMTGAPGYGVLEYGKFSSNRLSNKIDDICNNLGITYGGKSSNQKTTSMFDKQKGTGTVKNRSFDDIEAEM